MAHSPECRVLFVVVPNVSQASAPRSDELVETGRHLIGTHQTHPPDGDGSVLQQSLGRVGTVDDGDQGLEQDRDVVLHIRTKLHRYLSCQGYRKTIVEPSRQKAYFHEIVGFHERSRHLRNIVWSVIGYYEFQSA